MNNKLKFWKSEDSIIKSLEKNPAIKGNPHRAKLAITIDIEVRGNFLNIFPIERKSCPWEWKLIKIPQQIKSRALNKAWVIKWKNAKVDRFRDKDVAITPNCLNVESATIFFISFSTTAANPAINIVVSLIIISI